MAIISLDDLLEQSQALMESVLELERVRFQKLSCFRGRTAFSFDEVVEMMLGKGCLSEKRCVVGIGGFPGSGKTTAAKAIVNRINSEFSQYMAVHLPMDGFHFENEKLKRLKLDHMKGDISTYDIGAYAAAIERFINFKDMNQSVPDYDRGLHEVVENAIEIPQETKILVTEGIYVGINYGLWRIASATLDLLLFLDVEPRISLERVVARNIVAGRSKDIIFTKISNDLSFMKNSIKIIDSASIIVRLK